MSGVSAAAVAIPSFFPATRSVALAKGMDPMLAEISSQFQQQMMELGGSTPKGDAIRLAATYRMLAAWGNEKRLDRRIRNVVADVVALEGRDNIIAKMVAFDRIADLKQRGFPVPPNMGNLTWSQVDTMLKRVQHGFSLEQSLRDGAKHIERNAAKFNAQLRAVANGKADGAAVRLIHDPTGGEQPMDGESSCTQNPDGSFSCNVSGPQVEQEPADCTGNDLYTLISDAEWTLLCFMLLEFCFIGFGVQTTWYFFRWYIGCGY